MKVCMVLVLILQIFLSSALAGNITINGKTYSGQSITINDGIIIIDGKRVDSIPDQYVVNIVGNVKDVHSDQSISIQGSVIGSATANGSINANDIGGDVNAGGSVNASIIRGSVQAGGSVNCAR